MSTLKLVESDQLSFNYDLVAVPVAIKAREAAERIRLRLRRSAEDIIEIGRDLIATKEALPHGQFLPWIEAEFGMGEHTARRFMGVARQYSDKSSIVRDLDPTALYELAAPKTPEEVREEVEKMIEAGEVVTKATVQELRNKLSGLEKAKELAEQEIDEKTAKVAEIETTIHTTVSTEIEEAAKRIAKGYEDEIARLKRENAELRKPKNITTIDNSTGKIVQFHRELTDEEAADIDAENDDLIGADFNEVATKAERAIAFFGAVRAMASAKAEPAAVYSYISNRSSQTLIAEYMAMVDAVMSQLQSVKEMHNG